MPNATLTDDLHTYNGAALPDTGRACKCPECLSEGLHTAPVSACLWVSVFDIVACRPVQIRRAAYAADKARPVAQRRYEPIED